MRTRNDGQRKKSASEQELLRAVAIGDQGAMEEIDRIFRPQLIQFVLKYQTQQWGFTDRTIAEDVAQETLARVSQTADRYQPQRGKASRFIFRIAQRILKEEAKRHEWAANMRDLVQDTAQLVRPGRGTLSIQAVSRPSFPSALIRLTSTLGIMLKILSYAFRHPLTEGVVELDTGKVRTAHVPIRPTRSPESQGVEMLLGAAGTGKSWFLTKEYQASLTHMKDERPELYEILHLFFVEGLSHQEIAEKLSIPMGTSKTRLMRGKKYLEKQLERFRKERTP